MKFFPVVIGFSVLILLSRASLAIEFSVESIDEVDGYAIATLKLRNDDAPTGYRVIAVDCAWLKDGIGVVYAADSITDLEFHDTSFLEVKARLRDKKFDNAICHVNTAIKN